MGLLFGRFENLRPGVTQNGYIYIYIIIYSQNTLSLAIGELIRAYINYGYEASPSYHWLAFFFRQTNWDDFSGQLTIIPNSGTKFLDKAIIKWGFYRFTGFLMIA